MNNTPSGYPSVSDEERQRQQYQQYQQYQQWQQQQQQQQQLSHAPTPVNAYPAASPQQFQQWQQPQQQQAYPHAPTPIRGGYNAAANPPSYLSPNPQGGQQNAPPYNPHPGSPYDRPKSAQEDRPRASYDRPRSSYDAPRGTLSAPPRSPNPSVQRPIQGVYASGPPRDRPPPPTGMAAVTSKLKNIAPGESVEALLNPPPPCFLREPAQDMSYAPFQPTALVGPSEGLDKGFGVMVPPWPPSRGPHPFATHDVREEDWERFLGDLQKAASLTGRDKVVAAVVPMVAGVGFAGMFISRAMEKGMKSRKRGPAGELVDNWNHYFFTPRGITITLAQGSVTFSGHSDGPPPDAFSGQNDSSLPGYPGTGYTDQSASTSSASTHDMSRRDKKKEDRHHKKEEREQKRAEKHQHKQEKKDEKKSKEEPWRLIISPARPEFSDGTVL